MSNLKVYLPAVDGSAYILQDEQDSCKEAIHTLFTDDFDFAAPPRSMVIQVTTGSGKVAKVLIPYEESKRATVKIDDVEV